MKDTYFKYKIRKKVGYAKISEQSDIKFLEKCKLNGFVFIRKNRKNVYFSITNQLYRLLKLSQLDNKPVIHKVKILNLMIERSEQIENMESEDYWYQDYWYDNTNTYYDNEISMKKAEYKDRLRNQNRQYKLKLKR